MIVSARWVVPVGGPLIEHGYVAFARGRIEAVGASASLPASAERLELRDCVLLPGLVNCHTHLELTHYCAQLPPGPFWHWIGGLVRLRAARGQREREQDAVRVGAEQCLQAGVTCVGDISRCTWQWPVLRRSPLRKVCFAELLSIADQPARDPAELRTAVLGIEEDDRLRAGISPHAPYTVPSEHAAAAIALAEELDRPWVLHLAETQEERAFLRGEADAMPDLLATLQAERGVRSPGCDPITFLEQIVPAAARAPGLLAHMNYLEAAEVTRMAGRGERIVYCPRAHAFFGHSAHPIDALRAAGIEVAIGTDSAASNENLALLEELRVVARRTGNSIEADALVEMVTRVPAEALGWGREIGTLEVGKRADLAAFEIVDAGRDPLGALIASCPRARHVWIDGEAVALG